MTDILPQTVTRTRLWQATLEVRTEDPERDSKQALQEAYKQFRHKAALLAAEIPRYLPEFTDHSIVHLDALWEIADLLIADSGFVLNPAEAFAFGGAVLLHDCAMSLAAYPAGLAEIKTDPAWGDTLAALYLQEYNRKPTPEEIASPSVSLANQTLSAVLRLRHAERAEALATQHWTERDGSAQYLLDNARLRNYFGDVIGKLAHSHHWSADRLARELPSPLGALGGFPPTWIIDPLRIACLLRAADVCHLDERRAPTFLRAVRDVGGTSACHWQFQNTLTVPTRDRDSLIFSATRPFGSQEYEAWWLCYETLRMADRELREVDAILGERGYPRLAVRRIAGAADPEQLTKYIRVHGWKPIDVRLSVGHVPQLLERFGGKALYGNRPWIALRELLQNALDAVRARRALEGRSDTWGTITVSLGSQCTDAGSWLHIEDNGLGMTSSCIRDHLLTFGSSYWQSRLLASEHPGFLANAVSQTGYYGIGFFAIFMLGNEVVVTTRKIGFSDSDTLVLELRHGTLSRPLFRSARPEERLKDSGTRVSVRLAKHVACSEHGLLGLHCCSNLKDLIRYVCPAPDADLYWGDGNKNQKALAANDWQTADTADLADRMGFDITDPNQVTALDGLISDIRDEKAALVGRGCIIIPSGLRHRHERLFKSLLPSQGALLLVSPGGLRMKFDYRSVFGIMFADVTTISREEGDISPQWIAEWATQQAALCREAFADGWTLAHIAAQIKAFSGDIRNLPFGFYKNNWLDRQRFMTLAETERQIRLAPESSFRAYRPSFRTLRSLEDYDLLRRAEDAARDKASEHTIIVAECTDRWRDYILMSQTQDEDDLLSTFEQVLRDESCRPDRSFGEAGELCTEAIRAIKSGWSIGGDGVDVRVARQRESGVGYIGIEICRSQSE